MLNQPLPDGALRHDLGSYFALTTSTEMPLGVSAMSVRTLAGPRHRHPRTLLAGALGVAAAIAMVFVVSTQLGSRQGTEYGSLSAGGSAQAPFSIPAVRPYVPPVVAYPGVDASELARDGVVLSAPSGHGQPLLGSAQAQAVAASAVGARSGQSGPAVLAFAELTGPLPPAACLCWVVEVPTTKGLVPGGASVSPRQRLVLVDADNGRIVAAIGLDATR